MIDKPVTVLLALGTLLATGCEVGPKYVKPPALPSPPAFKEPLPSNATDSSEWKTATPMDQVERGKWWVIFGDARLNNFEDQLTQANQNLQLAEARLRQARAAIRFNRASQFPSIGFSPSILNERDSGNQPYFSPSLVNNGTGNFVLPLELSYEVDLWGRVRRSVTAAKDEAQSSAGDVEAAKLSLHGELARDYFGLRSADLQERLLQDTVKTYEHALKITEDRYNGGAAPRADVEQARTQLQSAQVLETDIVQVRANYEHAIAVLVGNTPAHFSIAQDKDFVLRPPQIPVGVAGTLLERRPDVAAAERRVAAANEQIGIAKAAYFPQVTIGAAAGFQSAQASNWFSWPSRLWAVGPSVSQVIYDGGRRRAVSEGAGANYDATVAVYREDSLTAFQEVEDNLVALNVLAKEVEQQRSATASAERALDLFTKRYQDGVDTYLQVVTSQTNALSNESNDIDLRRRQMDASVLLIKAVGGGWDRSQLPSF
jgi:NodT family efflux transporter outer membrane factor (OMF) lipoprotein